MRIGLLADIHANLEALEAVLTDGRGRVQTWWFLGDAVGRGPNPVEVIQKLQEVVPFRQWQIGNHDLYTVERASNAGIKGYEQVIHRKHREALRGYRVNGARPLLWAWCRRNWQRQRTQPRHLAGAEVDYWLVHGALGSEIFNAGFGEASHYIFPWDVHTSHMAEQVAYLQTLQQGGRTTVLIHGHTHIPYIAIKPHALSQPLLSPIRYEEAIRLDRFDLILLNPGSVGQPRNGDRMVHAAYGILDTEADTFEFRKVPYDCEPTCKKMMRYGYERNLIDMLRGNHDHNPIKQGNMLWLRWRQTYEERPWGWQPLNTSAGGAK